VADDQAWRVVALFAAITLVMLAGAWLADSEDHGLRIWEWLTSSEDLGKRLRRECESVAREAHPTARGPAREGYVRDCIDARARLMR
jgi:hypothetical protein